MDEDLKFGIATGGDQVRILSFAAEGVPITRADVHAYQNQLVAVRQQSQAARPVIGLLSSVENPLTVGEAPVQRNFGLSDETSRSVASIDKAEVDRIMAQLHLDLEMVQRAWATPQQQAAETANYFNYGLNEKLLREYIAAQVGLRLERGRRMNVAGNRDFASVRNPRSN